MCLCASSWWPRASQHQPRLSLLAAPHMLIFCNAEPAAFTQRSDRCRPAVAHTYIGSSSPKLLSTSDPHGLHCSPVSIHRLTDAGVPLSPQAHSRRPEVPKCQNQSDACMSRCLVESRPWSFAYSCLLLVANTPLLTPVSVHALTHAGQRFPSARISRMPARPAA